MYDVPDPSFKCSSPIRLNDAALFKECVRLTDVKIEEEYSVLRLTFCRTVPSDDDTAINDLIRSLEGLGIPPEAQCVRNAVPSAMCCNISIEVRNCVEPPALVSKTAPLPQNVDFRIVARQIVVPYACVMMWARLYLYQDGRVPDDDDEILSRAGSELTKHLPWWERWRPAFLGEDAIWQSEDETVYFDYRLGEHFYAEKQSGTDAMKIIDPKLELSPILLASD